MIDAVDTFEEHFRSRITVYNPSRKVLGIMDAMDYPPEQVELEAFYLLSLGDSPVPQAQSSIMPVYVHTIQISWIIVGADITQSNRGRNRATRYRTNYQMKRELLNGLYPYFTRKNTYAINPIDGSLVASPVSPEEDIIWSKAHFGGGGSEVGSKRKSIGTGVTYDMATVYVVDMTDKLTVNV